jgi:hypothetical protein
MKTVNPERLSMSRRPQVHLIVGAEYHDADFARRELLGLLAEDDRIATSCAAAFHDIDAMAAADLLITFTSNLFPDDAGQAALEAFIAQGGRWLAIHGSAACTRFKPPAIDVGGIILPGLTDTPDLQPAYMDLLGCRFISHLAPQPITVRPVSNHPVVRGLPPFTVTDEPYVLEIRGEVEVLLESRFTGEAPGYVEGPWLEDEARPQMILKRLGKGEILYLAPGHCCGRFDLQPFIQEVPAQTGPWLDETYREILRRSIHWGLAGARPART